MLYPLKMIRVGRYWACLHTYISIIPTESSRDSLVHTDVTIETVLNGIFRIVVNKHGTKVTK